MILIDEMKSMKIYKQPTFLPTLKDDKKKKSAILLLTPSYESSKKLMNHHLFKNVRRYMSYYLEKDVSYYIGSKDIEEVDENALIKAFLETSEYFEETKRSELPDDAFGVPSKRKFPLDTEAHVRSAIKFFNYVDPEDEAELARRIIAAMKKFNITDVRVSEKNRFSKYYTNPKKSTNEEVEIKEFYNYCGVEIYKSINETSIVNAKVLYHVSRSNLNNKTIKPSIPDNYFTKNGYEENKTPRVCFATSIDKCLRGLSQNCTNMELYVHVPDDISKYEVLKPNNKEVPDSVVTSERWICSPVNMKCIGKIKVTGDRGEDGLPFSYGDNKTAELYDWNWEWAEKYNESDPIEESILINEKDIYYNKDKFDSGEINLCFITGHSGSGKSTMSHKSENDTLEVYEMDDLQCIKDRFTMENLKEYGDLIYSYFNGPGKQFYVTYKELMEKNVPGSDYEDKLYPGFVNYAKQYAAKHKDKKYILEGVWLFCDDEHGKPYFKPEEFKDYAFYIKGTSAIISKFRAAKRDSQYEGGSEKVNKGFNRFKAFTKDFFTKNWKWYLIDEKRIKVFRDYFKNKPETVLESYVEETMNSEDFLSVVEEAGGLNIGDKVLFFNEDSSQTTNAQLKKLLFKSRIRYRKEVIALLDKVKAENPWIIYAFPEMKRLAGKNVFIDLYFYNSIMYHYD